MLVRGLGDMYRVMRCVKVEMEMEMESKCGCGRSGVGGGGIVSRSADGNGEGGWSMQREMESRLVVFSPLEFYFLVFECSVGKEVTRPTRTVR